MEKKSKIFQPKVIIGSIASFVVAAVGIIAVFFPNLFNLEKSSMGEGQFLLSEDESSHRKLWQFLEDNQGKVVQLEIAYCADFERMNFAATKNERNWYHENKLDVRAIDFIPKWYFGFGGEREWRTYGMAENLEKFAKYQNLDLIYYEGLGKLEKIPNELLNDAKITYYNVEYDGYDSVRYSENTIKVDTMQSSPVVAGEIASFVTYHYGNDIYPNVYGVNIQNGGIGFQFKAEIAKDMLISHPSNKNKKYIWVVGFENAVYKYLDKSSSLAKQAKKTCKAKQFQQDMLDDDVPAKDELLRIWGGSTLGYIKGAFYIHEKEEVNDDPGLSSLASIYDIYPLIDPQDFSREKFELEPFDKKDIELRKY